MASGIEIRDPTTGQLVFDITDRVFRILLAGETGTSNGSIPVSGNWSTYAVRAGIGPGFASPNVTRTGNTIAWDWGDVPQNERSSALIYLMTY